VRVPVTQAVVRWVSGGCRAWDSARRMVAAPLLAVVFLAAAPGSTAGADQVGNLSAQVQADEAQVNADAARIHQLTAAFDQASTQASALAQQVQGTAAQLTSLHNQVVGTVRTIRNEAVLAYTGQVSSSPEIAAANPTQIAVGQVYLRSTAGDLSDTLDALHLRQRETTSVQNTLRDEAQAHEHHMAEAAAVRQQALNQAAAAQQLLNQAQAQLVSNPHAAAQKQAQANAAAGPQGAPVGNSLVQTVASALNPPPTITPAASPPTYVSTPTTNTPPTTSARTTESAPTTAASAPSSGAGGSSSGQVARLRQCESGGNYRENSGDGYYGAYQLSQATWSSLSLPGRPDQAPPDVQDRAVLTLVARSGWGQWPTCSALLGMGG
jgi:peptidoglycan hydrolase CwlO-like protein